MPKDKTNTHQHEVIIDSKGSLGLLAIGDLGLRAWRKVKESESNSKSDAKE